MVQSILAGLGALGSLLLTAHIVRLRQGWLFTFGAVALGCFAFADLRLRDASSLSSVLWSVSAVVLGGLMLRRVWMTVAATAVLCGSLAPAVSQVLNSAELTADAAPALQVSSTGAACLLGLVLLSVSARNSSTLTRLIEQERSVNRRLWDCSTSGIAVVDRSARIVEWNPAMERLTGLSRGQVIGTVLTDLPDFNGESQLRCLRVASAGVEIASDESSAGSGGLKLYCSPLHDHRSRVIGTLVVVTEPASGAVAPFQTAAHAAQGAA